MLLATLLVPLTAMATHAESPARNVGNRFTFLDERGPYYPRRGFPRLTTPAWVGEPGVEAAVVLSIDDMGRPPIAPYDWTSDAIERFLAPVVQRLQRIDGRAPVSVFTCQARPADPVLQRMLKAGLSLEVHSFTHPVPLLRPPAASEADSLAAARRDVHDSLVSLGEVPGNRPVAFRMPGCDAQNTVSPRFYTEVLPLRTHAGRFLEADSSICMVHSAADASLPREWVLEADGRERFGKYVRGIPQTRFFVNWIADYPYPFVIDGRLWELPITVPGDAHGVHQFRANNPRAVEDWKRALDLTVRRQGLMVVCFHSIGYIKAGQVAELVDYADRTYGGKVKFLTCRDCVERLTRNLLGGQPLRAADGGDGGVRLLDVDCDGHLDVVGGRRPRTRVWHPGRRAWAEAPLPADVVEEQAGRRVNVARLFSSGPNGAAGMFVATPARRGCWRFERGGWATCAAPPAEVDGQPLHVAAGGKDRGVRFRDLDGDGLDDLVVNNEQQNRVYLQRRSGGWAAASFILPKKGLLVDAAGRDRGSRFTDLNGDGLDDLLHSDEESFGIFLRESRERGWKLVRGGKAGATGAPPPIVAAGALGGVWLHAGHLVRINEHSADRKEYHERWPLAELLRGTAATGK